MNLNENIFARAAKLTGIREKTSLIHLGLETLIAFESGKRLARLGGSEKSLKSITRRRD